MIIYNKLYEKRNTSALKQAKIIRIYQFESTYSLYHYNPELELLK